MTLSKKYEKHYIEFLGDSEEGMDGTIKCFQRSIPICKYFYHFIICTNYSGKEYISVAPEYFDEVDGFIKRNGKKSFLKGECEGTADLNRREMIRFGLSSEGISYNGEDEKVAAMSSIGVDTFAKTYPKVSRERIDNIWNEFEHRRNQGRIFCIVEDGIIVSQGEVSDIFLSGGNIKVWTRDEYQGRGYGKAVAVQAVRWCLENDILPIYLVDSENVPSVKIAESMGMEKLSREVIFSKKIR